MKIVQCMEKVKGINHKNTIEVFYPELRNNQKYSSTQVVHLKHGPKLTADINPEIFDDSDSLERSLSFGNILERKKDK